MTLVVIILAVHLALPLALLAFLGWSRPAARLEWALRAGMAGTYIAYVALAGQWSWLGYHLRLVWIGAFGAALWISHRRSRPAPWWTAPPARQAWMLGLQALAVLAFAGPLADAVRGFRHEGAALELAFPLRDGRYYVANGGSTLALNLHVRVPAQRYGIDIVELDALGLRARGLYPRALDRYVIFGRTIHAPCTGRVAAAVDRFADLHPPEADRLHELGNHVIMACGGATLVVAHMMRGSVRVRPGDAVVRGQPLGRVGNSGNTSEPHLHLHAVDGNVPDPRLNGIPRPMTFGGRFLVRNCLVR